MTRKAFLLTILLPVLSHDSLTANQLGKDTTVIPFKLVGNTIIVNATVNGITGNFVLDTGSPDLLLNNAYFKGTVNPHQTFALTDFLGHVNAMQYYYVRDLSLHDFRFPSRYAFTMDLKNLQKTKKILIHGIIGYSVLKEVEMVFDFKNQQIVMMPVNKKGKPANSMLVYEIVDSFDLKMCDHLTYVVAKQGKKKLRFALDSGSEINVLNKKSLKKKALQMEITDNLIVSGLNNNYMACGNGIVRNLTLDDRKVGPQEMALVDMQNLNRNLQVKMDGILGAPFLLQGVVSINFKKRKMYVRREADGVMVAQNNDPNNLTRLK